MKRSKIFLGISTGVLAVVAFTAAKSAKFSNLRNAYYAKSGSSICTVKASLQFYSVAASGAIQATNGQTPSANLFTYDKAGCTHVLYAAGAE